MIFKKFVTSLIFTFLFLMFLVYSGVFRDMANPLNVVSYYVECIKKRQGFLTYSICKREIFDDDRFGEIYSKYCIREIKRLEFKLIKKDNVNAQVKVQLIYKDNNFNSFFINLEKSEENWIIVKGF